MGKHLYLEDHEARLLQALLEARVTNHGPKWEYDVANKLHSLLGTSTSIQVTQVSGGTDSGSPQEEGRASGEGSSEAAPDGPPASVSSKATRNTHQERILKSAVAMARATIGLLVARVAKKELNKIFYGDGKDIVRTQERLEEAWKLLDPIGAKMERYHGCFTGDCPHEKQEECDADIAKHRAELEAEAAESPLPVTQTDSSVDEYQAQAESLTEQWMETLAPLDKVCVASHGRLDVMIADALRASYADERLEACRLVGEQDPEMVYGTHAAIQRLGEELHRLASTAPAELQETETLKKCLFQMQEAAKDLAERLDKLHGLVDSACVEAKYFGPRADSNDGKTLNRVLGEIQAKADAIARGDVSRPDNAKGDK